MNDDNRLLMSDDIRGRVPELEDEVSNYKDGFIMSAVELQSRDKRTVLIGSLSGFSKDDNMIKLDIRVNVKDGYEAVKSISSAETSSSLCQIRYLDDELNFVGKYRVTSPKLLDFDPIHKMCTIGIDLVRV